MRKLTVAALVAAAAFGGTSAPGASAAEMPTGPCAIVQNAFETYHIEFGMYNEQLAFVLRTTCGITG